MKIGLLLNISIFCGMLSGYLLVWILDGTLLRTLSKLMDI
jgi:hypothetical protein